MAINISHLLVIFIVLLVIQPIVQSRNIQESFKSLQNLGVSQKRQTVKGLHEIKSYLNRLGYLNYDQTADLTNVDEFDENLEEAVKTYQKNFGLNVTGQLDSNTVKYMAMPRCGSNDNNMGLQYVLFPGNLRWNRRNLTYMFDSSVTGDTLTLLRASCTQALSQWEKVPGNFTFTEKPVGGDIKIGHYWGAHGDAAPFDGPGGVLAHSSPPTLGGLVHFDAAEQWSITPNHTQFDTVGVALHEFGHALGLAHTNDTRTVMYPIIGPGYAKRIPTPDEVQGIKVLYAL